MYHGGKSRQAPFIVRALRVAAQGRTHYLEPFVGGANILVRTPTSWRRTAADTSLDLILMWQALQDGWTPPAHITKDQYEEQRHAPPSPLRGFTGYACSWGAKWWGGYGTHRKIDLAETNRRWLLDHRSSLRGVDFQHADYTSHPVDAGTIVYCDPPYADTTGYRTDFDTDKFWYTCEKWIHTGAAVLVSEYAAPAPWVPVRTRSRYTAENRSSHTDEHLWRHPDEHQPHLGDTL